MNAAQIEPIKNRDKSLASLNLFVVQWLARVAFGLSIITLPWRLVLWRWKRPFPPIYADFTDFLLLPQDVFLLITLLFWGISLAIQPRRLLTGPWFVWIPLVGLTLISWVSVPMSVDRPLSVYHAVRLLLLLGLYLYLVNELGTEQLAPPKEEGAFRIIAILTISLAIQIGLQAVIGLSQWWQQQDLGLQWLGEQTLAAETSNVIWAAGGKQAIKAYGLTDHPNILAMNLAMGLLLLFALIFVHREWVGMWLLPIFGGGTAVLLLTFFRPGWIALTAAIIFMVWMARRIESKNPKGFTSEHLAMLNQKPLGFERGTFQRTRRIIVGIMIISFLLPLKSVLPYMRLEADGASAALIAAQISKRAAVQQQGELLTLAANEIFTQHALTGTGIGTLPIGIQQSFPEFKTDYQPTRINFINVAAEIGLFGALFYGMLLLFPWLMIFINRRQLFTIESSLKLKDRMFLIGMLSALLAVTMLNFSDAYAWFYPAGRFWQWLLWGLWAASYKEFASLQAASGK